MKFDKEKILIVILIIVFFGLCNFFNYFCDMYSVSTFHRILISLCNGFSVACLQPVLIFWKEKRKEKK